MVHQLQLSKSLLWQCTVVIKIFDFLHNGRVNIVDTL